MELRIAGIVLVGAALVTIPMTSWAREVGTPATFRVVAGSGITTNDGIVILIAVKNVSSKRLYLSQRGRPLIWGYAYDLPPPPGAKRPGALGDRNSVVRSSSHTTSEGENYCPELDELMAVEPGGELLIPGRLSKFSLKDGTYTIDIDCAILRLDGVIGCAPAVYARGIARARVDVRKGLATIGPSVAFAMPTN